MWLLFLANDETVVMFCIYGEYIFETRGETKVKQLLLSVELSFMVLFEKEISGFLKSVSAIFFFELYKTTTSPSFLTFSKIF